MMNTLEKIRILRDYYDVTRKAGHTTLMKEGTKNYKEDFFIVAPTKNYNGEMECKPEQVVSWNTLKNLYGNKKPLAFDNSMMHLMLNEICEHMQDLENENNRLKRTLKTYMGS